MQKVNISWASNDDVARLKFPPLSEGQIHYYPGHKYSWRKEPFFFISDSEKNKYTRGFIVLMNFTDY